MSTSGSSPSISGCRSVGKFAPEAGITRQPFARVRVGEVDPDEDQAERDDGEVEAAQPHRDRGHEDADERGADARAREPDPDRQAQPPHRAGALAAEHRTRVRADAHEEGDARATTWPATPVSRLSPSAAMAKTRRHGHRAHPVAVAQEPDERDLVDDRQVEGHQEEDATANRPIATFCVQRREDLVLLLVGGLQAGAVRTCSDPPDLGGAEQAVRTYEQSDDHHDVGDDHRVAGPELVG